jgi:hypothetical protein
LVAAALSPRVLSKNLFAALELFLRDLAPREPILEDLPGARRSVSIRRGVGTFSLAANATSATIAIQKNSIPIIIAPPADPVAPRAGGVRLGHSTSDIRRRHVARRSPRLRATIRTSRLSGASRPFRS